MFDLISIGDCVIDTFVPLTDAEIVTSLTSHETLLGLRSGDKVPVGQSVSMVAGNAANNAVGASRLQLKTAIYTNVGRLDDDKDDDRIKLKLKKEKVDLRYVVETDDLPSNHNIILDYKGERTILVHHQPWKFNLPNLDATKWVYLTSLAPSFIDSPLMEQLVRYLDQTGAKMVFNPGTFQLKHGVKKYPRILNSTTLFIVNLEEAKLILGFNRMEDIAPKKLLKGIADLGPKMVIITDGHKGSFGFDGEDYWKLGIFPTKLKQMTGAGDAYATGALAGIFYGEDLPEAMRWGAANGAAVVEQIGAQTGLLTYEEMIGRLKQNPEIIAKELK
ncbi:hypothetical protein A2631_03885 [Candidatus Daviesbacteria bacterium RIFCSPHIGHO2_01_FULL_44_29]|uniref:Carbohydrate kinase PfkB domain-containing protein n=1 Tax=Candidatus Daviesbacteria bacterium RIFCSPHIGHO2_02_FULL_43_12 TaxID=1797776 RepID=A0A1F5KFZ8_9BACT|nr:MAG: hypothetical protein A2631_03885 [Candidatus Daviesbacteria bacterium RIFCSPHIGHO2_01_FULL_44_29]OGE39873.1 MAG: hypothetical protein A3D25_03615 [Candidatus Daviesbacteria bacterium RIFCSPHIGHO2_02_FULL_43_12]OGE70446.1 MAG: hypothetical protein A3B55_01955 [Candidatus Daviesbacteria bacterium RIFCSPLOWO2_01_FULL_43_15]